MSQASSADSDRDVIDACVISSCCSATTTTDDDDDKEEGQAFHSIRIKCFVCDRWFHARSVGVPSFNAGLISFSCKDCVLVESPWLSEPSVSWTWSWKETFCQHRRNANDPTGFEKVLQSGSSDFLNKLNKRKFISAADGGKAKIFSDGSQLRFHDFTRRGFFRTPLLFRNIAGLGFTVPDKGFTLADVERYVGSDFAVDIIDVETQQIHKTSLGEYIALFSTPRSRRYNMLSLEYSKTPLNDLVTLPALVKSISWVDNFWPSNEKKWMPRVGKYCLIGMKGSYTDFHIDFGGTSVYYHVVKGMKRFYVIEPTADHLRMFEDFVLNAHNSSEVFFADVVGQENVYVVDIKAGETVLIPSGWIHAVVTPEDSLVFGGNFLHMNDAAMQFKINQMEVESETPQRYKFCYFEEMNWYMLPHILEILQGKRTDDCHDMSSVRLAASALLEQLRIWAKRDGADLNKKYLTDDDYHSCADLMESLRTILGKMKREKAERNGKEVSRKRRLVFQKRETSNIMYIK